MSEDFYILLFIISFFVIGSPIYFQNRRIARMADEDLKKINYSEWKTRFKTNIYIKMSSRIIWGLVLLSGFIFNFPKIYALGFRWITLVILVLGLAFIIWGILGFRKEIKQIQDLK